MRWARTLLHDRERGYEEIISLAESVPAGSEQLLFLPYLNAERLARKANSRAQFFGLTSSHSACAFASGRDGRGRICLQKEYRADGKHEAIASIGWSLPAAAPRAGYGWKLRRAFTIARSWFLPSRSVAWLAAECSQDALPAFSQVSKLVISEQVRYDERNPSKPGMDGAI